MTGRPPRAQSDVTKRLAELPGPLPQVMLIHLYIEHLLDCILRQRSTIRTVEQRILADHRTYGFAVKLSLVAHLSFLPEALFDNLDRFNSLRNRYAHQIDVDLATEFDRRFVQRDGAVLFGDVGAVRRAFEIDPEGTASDVLAKIREVTLGWLWEHCGASGIQTA